MIEVKNLTKKFGDITAVDDISFHVDEGEVFGFLGPNGARKTTTIRMLCCLISKTSGEAQIAGYQIGNSNNSLKIRSLEPLLAAPVTDTEVLAGKSIAAFVPSIASAYIGAVIFMFLVDLFTFGPLTYLHFPNWNIGVILLLLAPLSCILSIGINVLISSRSNDVRASQQFGLLILVPFAVVYFLAELNFISLTITNLLIMAAVLLIIDIIVFYIVKATFQREEILTKWK